MKLMGVLTASLLLFCLLDTATAADSLTGLELELSAGYRVDQLQWSIAGNLAGANPNVLSELTWEDLEVYQLQHRGRLEFVNEQHTNMATELSWLVSYGQIYSGDNQDSDYAGDNRTLEWSRSNNNADGGSVMDLSAAFGLKFYGDDPKSFVMPQFGLSLHEQNTEMTDGNQTLSNQAIVDAIYGPGILTLPPLGPFAGLDSSYDAKWTGPWLGLRAQKTFSDRVTLKAGFEYHWADLESKANWNLRSDFAHPVSFKHEGDGHGQVYELGADFKLTEKWSFTLHGKYQDWLVESGLDVTFLASGAQGATKLQEVTWESVEAMAGFSYKF